MPEVVNFNAFKSSLGVAVEGPQNSALKHGGGDGTSDGMETVDAKIAAAEARTDTKFAELRSDLKEFATTSQLRATVWGATAVIIATGLAAVAFGGDRFDAGMGMADRIAEQKARDQIQDQSVQRIEGKIDRLIEAQERAGDQQGQ